MVQFPIIAVDQIAGEEGKRSILALIDVGLQALVDFVAPKTLYRAALGLVEVIGELLEIAYLFGHIFVVLGWFVVQRQRCGKFIVAQQSRHAVLAWQILGFHK